MERQSGVRLTVEHQVVPSDEAENKRNAAKVVNDMLTSWRGRLGARHTVTRTYPLADAARVELISDRPDHVTAHHTTTAHESKYEYDGIRGQLTVDITPLGDTPPQPIHDPVILLDNLGRLLFEADIQERSRLAAEADQ